MNYYTPNNSARRRGIAATIAYIVVVVLLLLLVKLDRLDPIVLHYGEIEVVFEQPVVEGGATSEGIAGASSNEVATEPAPLINTPPVATQHTQTAVEVPASGTSSKPVEKPAESSTTQPERAVNPNALFNANSSSGGSGTSVSSTSSGSGSGSAGSGKSDMDWELAGRSVVGGLVQPEYNVQEAGKVVIKITVDETGRVKRADYSALGSTTQNNELIRAARIAAFATRFTASQNTIQEGTITYIFKLQ